MTANTRSNLAHSHLGRITSWWHAFEEALPGGRRRRTLWLALITLVMGVLITLVWLAGRYEASQLQSELESDTTEAVSDLRRQLARQTQSLQGLQSNTPIETFWNTEAQALLREHREWLRIESRDPELNLKNQVDTPLRKPIFKRVSRTDSLNETVQACAKARRISGPS